MHWWVLSTRLERYEIKPVITLLLHTGIHAQKLYALIRQQIHLDKRTGMLRLTWNCKNVREALLNTTNRSALNVYLEVLPPKSQYLFPSGKMRCGYTVWALWHLGMKYARQALFADLRSSWPTPSHGRGGFSALAHPNYEACSLDTTMLYIHWIK
ncbi:hypothetical protein KSF_088310 [Reticulibacter mediterranei]|uniref:Uncharacterized protein n=1 Tax=Reticulibacter mediterranei TaxID=2778369 RepID=A0A8J3N7M9_9CHLR|nr:hypothetical protein [Reticulibacter mediterranei]GHO98783.1 hypothetical protein KSF_088310 [Reticulibacter mediterranei]